MDFFNSIIAWFFFSLLKLLSIAKFDPHVTLVVDKEFEWTAKARLSVCMKQCVHRSFRTDWLHDLSTHFTLHRIEDVLWGLVTHALLGLLWPLAAVAEALHLQLVTIAAGAIFQLNQILSNDVLYVHTVCWNAPAICGSTYTSPSEPVSGHRTLQFGSLALCSMAHRDSVG